MADGHTKPISQIKIGDELPNGASVEGILLTNRNMSIPMFDYNGIYVSGSHLVWENNEWIPVISSKKALYTHYEGERLYSLRTTSREIFANSLESEIILFKDWEEIPSGNDMIDAEWDILVQMILGNTVLQKIPSKTDPLFSPTCFVSKNQRLVPLHTIQIGDIIGINTKGDLTRVIGIYRGHVAMDPTHLQEKWHTDGVWWKRDANWLHTSLPVTSSQKVMAHGIHLITDSGTFWVHSGTHSGIVRDFTEVGSDKLILATETILKLLNEKPNP